MAKPTAVLSPNLGLVLDQAPIAVPDGALQAGNNFRISGGKVSNLNLGWTRFGSFTLGRNISPAFIADPVTLIYSHVDRLGNQSLLFGTPTDLYLYSSATTVVLLNPTYDTGTVDVSSANPAVVTAASGSPMWDTNNVKEGDFIHFGAADQHAQMVQWYVVASVDSESQLTLTTAVTGAPLTGSAYTIRRTFTGSIDEPWEAVTFLHDGTADDDLVIFTNGVDNIVAWNGTADEVSDAGISFQAYHLALFKNQVLATAITEGGEFFPAEVRNSNPGFALDFVNGLASAFTIHDGSDAVSASIPLGDSVIFYSARHIHVADFVGDPFVYIVRTAVPNLGPIAGRLVGDYGDYHTFIGPDGQYSFDGAAVREIGQQVWRVVLRRRSPSREGRSFAFFDEENGELVWAVPLTTDVDEDGPETAYTDAYLENVKEKGLLAPISVRDLPFTTAGYFQRQDTLTWDQLTQTWEELTFRWNDIFFHAAFPFTLVGNMDGEIHTLGTSQEANGTPLVSFARFGRRPTADGRMRGLLARIYPFASEFAETDLTVTARMADSAQGEVSIVDALTFDQSLEEGGHFVSPYRAGRFYEVEFGTPGNAWELAGYDVDIKPGGRR